MRKRITGLAGAAIWLAIGSSFSFVMSSTVLRQPYSTIGIAGAAAIGAILIAEAVDAIRAGLRLPLSPRTPEDFRILRRFLGVFGAEIAAFVVVYRSVPPGGVEFFAALNVAIVGLHFLPLAHVFRVPRYYLLGSLFCGVAVVTAALVVTGTARGDVPFILPGLLLPPGTWAIAAANTREARALIAEHVPPAPTFGAVAASSVRLSA